jgi:hypothetical protein
LVRRRVKDETYQMARDGMSLLPMMLLACLPLNESTTGHDLFEMKKSE